MYKVKDIMPDMLSGFLGELIFYLYLTKIDQMNFTEASSIINNEIDQLDWNIEPKGLYMPVKHILSNGGKRLRPAVLLMSASIFTSDIKKAISPAIGVELFHNSTLLHDDLMDGATLRRNQTTVHVKWDANTAILSGDAMILLAAKYVSNCPVEFLGPVLNVYNKVVLEVCDGQQYDMDFEVRENVSVNEYLKMIELKTAVLLAGSIKMGAILGGASQYDQNKLYDFGLNLGLAFQMVDDLLDVYGDEATFGKEIGGDITSNKKTFMLISAQNKANGEDKETLVYWLKKEDFNREDKIREVTSVYNKLGIKKLAEDKAEEYFQKSLAALNQLSVKNATVNELANLAKLLLKRNN